MKTILTILTLLLTSSIYSQSDSIRYVTIAEQLAKKHLFIQKQRDEFIPSYFHQKDTIQYTKKQFNSLMPFEKKVIKKWCKQRNITFPIWKDTTITNLNKFEVHQYALKEWELREERIQAREKARQEAWRTSMSYYATSFLVPYPSYYCVPCFSTNRFPNIRFVP